MALPGGARSCRAQQRDWERGRAKTGGSRLRAGCAGQEDKRCIESRLRLPLSPSSSAQPSWQLGGHPTSPPSCSPGGSGTKPGSSECSLCCLRSPNAPSLLLPEPGGCDPAAAPTQSQNNTHGWGGQLGRGRDGRYPGLGAVGPLPGRLCVCDPCVTAPPCTAQPCLSPAVHTHGSLALLRFKAEDTPRGGISCPRCHSSIFLRLQRG